jgi:hypothetical protein
MVWFTEVYMLAYTGVWVADISLARFLGGTAIRGLIAS